MIKLVAYTVLQLKNAKLTQASLFQLSYFLPTVFKPVFHYQQYFLHFYLHYILYLIKYCASEHLNTSTRYRIFIAWQNPCLIAPRESPLISFALRQTSPCTVARAFTSPPPPSIGVAIFRVGAQCMLVVSSYLHICRRLILRLTWKEDGGICHEHTFLTLIRLTLINEPIDIPTYYGSEVRKSGLCWLFSGKKCMMLQIYLPYMYLLHTV